MNLWLILAAIVVVLLRAVYYNCLSPLAKLPTIHWSVRWTRCHLLYTKYFSSVRRAHYSAHLHPSGGHGFQPIVRTGPNEVSIMTTDGVQTVFGGGFDRSAWYDVFSNFGSQNMFSFGPAQAHAQRRRVLASAYSKTSISHSQVQNIIKTRTTTLLRFIAGQISNEIGVSGPLVVRNVFRALQADIFTAFAFSEKEGTSFLDRLRSGANTMEDLGMEMMDLCHDERRDTFLFWESEKPFKYIGRFVATNGPVAHTKAQRWLSGLIAKYEANLQSDERAYLDKPLSGFSYSPYRKMFVWRNSGTGRQLSWNERASEIMDHCVAGQDAVPAALEFMTRTLSLHPKVQSRLRVELLSSVPLDAKDRTFAMIDNLPYLNAVIMESLRLVNTISSYQTRVVPPGGCVISGYFLPASTIVSSQPYLINRQPNIFPSPETFDPSRWLVPRESYRTLAKSMWTYSSGPRGCIGQELSLAIMKTVLVDMYMRYSTRSLNEDRMEKRPWEGADRMSELQFEWVINCAEGESIGKRAPRSSIYLQDTSQEGGTEKLMEPARSPSMFQNSEDALGVIGNVGRRPSVMASDMKNSNASERVGNNEHQPLLSLSVSLSLQPAKIDLIKNGTSMILSDRIHNQLSHTLRNPSHNLPISPTTTHPPSSTKAVSPDFASIVPAASESAGRAESAELVDTVTQTEPSQDTTRSPIARFKRPQLLHRTSSPDRVDGVLKLVGQDSY